MTDPMRCSPATLKSFRRSRLRRRVLLALAQMRAGFGAQVARRAKVRSDRIRGVMWGAPPHYAVELALVELGFATARATPQGVLFEVTDAGLDEARAWRGRPRLRGGSAGARARPP